MFVYSGEYSNDPFDGIPEAFKKYIKKQEKPRATSGRGFGAQPEGAKRRGVSNTDILYLALLFLLMRGVD